MADQFDDVHDEIANRYNTWWPLKDAAPHYPWAMLLAGTDQRYRFVPFDFDTSKGNAAYDGGRMSYWLDELNIPHIVCISGPSGGRHVWLALSDSASAGDVATLASLTKQLLPSLDVRPLENPLTGAVRPPGSPHRRSGFSEPQGPLTALLEPSVTSDQLAALRDFLIDAGASIVVPPTSLQKGTAYGAGGHPYLLGTKRPLSRRIRSILSSPPDDDASLTVAIVLAGCAQARWRHEDVIELARESPALEHLRSQRAGSDRRIPRSDRAAASTLKAAWRHAVTYVASRPVVDRNGDDPEFEQRTEDVAAAVSRAQDRADAMPGLWGLGGAATARRRRRGTHSHRAVLNALCLYMAQAVSLEVETDVRRLSADTGYGRTWVEQALLALQAPAGDDPETGWIVRVGSTEGAHGQRYRLAERFSTELSDQDWSQARVRPRLAVPHRDRSWWINYLSLDLDVLNHDAFAAPGSLGRTAGLVYKHLPPGATVQLPDLVRSTALPPHELRGRLQRLTSHGLVRRAPGGWARPDADLRDLVAQRLGVAGYLDDRAARYGAERRVWAWWLAEYAWMTKTHKKRKARRMPTGVVLFAQNDRPDYSRYPRGPDHRGDHREARRLVDAGVFDVPQLEVA